ncbi:hypothetical protein ADA01nite_33370 [Aneurinibacillus danicus]|uniref:Uncharacterized protein n=1 Tax=Aneurinibacillus danicus TaxID=267746 RepID=A0A511VAC6_9BACL|nr:hypothetical protein ADA01nite_33370 [Aneurinibacillus danicus]
MIKKGLIRRDPTKPRAIEILDGESKSNISVLEKVKMVRVPVVGKVTAGLPITAIEYDSLRASKFNV